MSEYIPMYLQASQYTCHSLGKMPANIWMCNNKKTLGKMKNDIQGHSYCTEQSNDKRIYRMVYITNFGDSWYHLHVYEKLKNEKQIPRIIFTITLLNW